MRRIGAVLLLALSASLVLVLEDASRNFPAPGNLR
jgi:hypothetical protein